jgi:hypothetical protein
MASTITLPDPQDWVSRLTEYVPDLQHVGLWRDVGKLLADASRNVYRFPAALVIPEADRSNGGTTTNPYVTHIVTARWGVLIGVRSYRDQSGTDAGDSLRTYRADIMEALLGWTQATTQITYAGGRVMNMSEAILWWQDSYEFDYLVRMLP